MTKCIYSGLFFGWLVFVSMWFVFFVVLVVIFGLMRKSDRTRRVDVAVIAKKKNQILKVYIPDLVFGSLCLSFWCNEVRGFVVGIFCCFCLFVCFLLLLHKKVKLDFRLCFFPSLYNAYICNYIYIFVCEK